MIRELAQDTKHAWRALRKAPYFTAIAALTLAIGMGATVAIFTVANGVFLAPLAYKEPSRLVHVQGEEDARFAISMPLYRAIEAGVTSFEESAVYQGWAPRFQVEGRWVSPPGSSVSANYFRLLGARAALGRLFTREDGAADHAPVVVLSHEAWREYFQGRPNIIGSLLRVGEETYQVAGVLEPDLLDPVRTGLLGSPTNTALFRAEPPLFRNAQQQPGWTGFWAIARLRSGVTVEAARAEVRRVVRNVHPDWSTLPHEVRTFRDAMSGHLRGTLLALLLGGVLVMLIGCANVANLLLGRAVARTREMAIRTTLGAPRSRLIRQLLMEGLLLSALALVPALLLAHFATGPMVAIVASQFRLGQSFAIDWRVAAFAAAVAAACAIIFGLAPGLHASDVKSADALRSGGRAIRGEAARLRSSLVAAEIAMSVLLLFAAGVIGRTLWNLRAVDPGFDHESTLSILTMLPSQALPGAGEQNQTVAAVERELSALPGVAAAGGITDLPMSGAVNSGRILRRGESTTNRQDGMSALTRAVTPGYFDAMGMRLLAGRAVTEHDQADGEQIAVVNATFARQMFPEGDVLDQLVVVRGVNRRIVGVVSDVVEFTLQSPERDRVLYTSYAQEKEAWMRGSVSFVLRSQLRAEAMELPARKAIARASPSIIVGAARPMRFYVDRDIELHRFRTFLVLLFGGAAVFLSGVGVAAVSAYTVSRRIPEIGLRMALGSTPGEAVRTIMRPLARTAVLGVAIGIAAALVASRLLEVFLFGVQPHDPLALAGAALVMLPAALLAGLVPAGRAASVDPALVLRSE